MTAEVLYVDEPELLIEEVEGDRELLEVDSPLEILEVAEQGPPGPPGTGDNTGADGQIWTSQSHAGYWADPPQTGIDPSALAAALAFAAAHG